MKDQPTPTPQVKGWQHLRSGYVDIYNPGETTESMRVEHGTIYRSTVIVRNGTLGFNVTQTMLFVPDPPKGEEK